MSTSQGEFFPESLQRDINARFHHVDRDIDGRERLFFDNAGGSLRLKAAVDAFARVDAVPDCPERNQERARYLQDIQARSEADIRAILNAHNGSIYPSLTASGGMFDMVRAIMENVPGTNAVTTILEHPCSYDAMVYYAQRTGKTLRVAPSNPVTGGVDVDAIVSLIDENTAMLSVMYASNISGAKFDIEAIVKRARERKPGLFVVVDAVQHAPHGVIDLQKTPVDGINFAPYKFFGCRGSGISWLSPRAGVLPHHRLAAKLDGTWELGSPAPAQFAAMTEIVDYVTWIGGHFTDAEDRRGRFVEGMSRIELQERALLGALLDGHRGEKGLRHLEGVEVLWDYPDLTKRGLIAAIRFTNLRPADAAREYEKRGVIVFQREMSSLHSARMLKSFNIDGAVRISPLHCHTPRDVERFLAITRELAA
jgi:selenocysteine lyase/cysteine desulfurase